MQANEYHQKMLQIPNEKSDIRSTLALQLKNNNYSIVEPK